MVFELFFVAVIVILLIVVVFLIKEFYSIKKQYDDLRFSKQSQSVKYGQLTEQWIPFSKDFPYSSQNFRFIGKPIDGLVFEEDKVVFVEFKTNKSALNESQKKIKELIEKKKVEWFELRID